MVVLGRSGVVSRHYYVYICDRDVGQCSIESIRLGPSVKIPWHNVSIIAAQRTDFTGPVDITWVLKLNGLGGAEEALVGVPDPASPVSSAIVRGDRRFTEVGGSPGKSS